jgi:Rhamnan synthesis protein F
LELWKVKREALRTALKIYDRARYPFDRIKQVHYDTNFHNLTKTTSGKQTASDKVAVFFVYQPDKLGRSIFVTCKFLSEKGYSVILVSSTPISAIDKQDLTEHCWKILERPNYGYDFGGYRDGLRIMQESGIKPEKLIILNDSIWFPLSSECRLIERLDAENISFNSPVYEGNPRRSKKNQHFQSFFFLLDRRAIESSCFVDFWKNYKISSAKRVVLLRGEKGFSQAMFSGGFGKSLISTKIILSERLREQSNEFLRITLGYAAYDDPLLLAEAQQLLANFADTEEWRVLALDHMADALTRTHPLGIFIYATIKLMEFSFLKKRSFAAAFDGMRWQYLRAVENGDLPSPHPDILAEIRASKMDGSLTTDPSIPAPISATKVK